MPHHQTLPTPSTSHGTSSSLHVEGRGRGPRLVMAHGFTQTSRVWAGMDDDLAQDHEVVTVDMPGHGGSAAVRSTLVDGALLLGAAGGRAAYLGYSMGARFCLHLALACPHLVDSLVLISGTAGIEDPDERLDRCRSDGVLADRLDPPAGDRAAQPVEVFVRAWMDNPMFAGIDPGADGFEERLTNTGPGLASSLRRAGTGTQLPLWGKLGRLAMPVLVITGEDDVKFTGLGRRMVAAIGDGATLAVVPGTGHAPHLQRPDEVAGLVRSHLDRGGPA
jgi:2-succinyl-6-hydroxy-2,4-cyclohexadiene-1-carboxylate synthase